MRRLARDFTDEQLCRWLCVCVVRRRVSRPVGKQRADGSHTFWCIRTRVWPRGVNSISPLIRQPLFIQFARVSSTRRENCARLHRWRTRHCYGRGEKIHASECAQLEVRERLPRCLMGSPGSRSGAEPRLLKKWGPAVTPRLGAARLGRRGPVPAAADAFITHSVRLPVTQSAGQQLQQSRMLPLPDARSIDTLLDEYIDTSNVDRDKSRCFVLFARPHCLKFKLLFNVIDRLYYLMV